MSELKRTELRHRMLAEFAAGEIEFSRGWGGDIGRYLRKSRKPIVGGEKRAATDLDHARLVTFEPSFGFDMKRAMATPAGRALLAEWNTKFGEVSA